MLWFAPFCLGHCQCCFYNVSLFSRCCLETSRHLQERCDVKWKQLVPEENHEFRIQLDVKKKYNWGQIENSCRIQGGNVDEMGLGSGVSRLMKEEMFPAADEAQITAGEAIRAH